MKYLLLFLVGVLLTPFAYADNETFLKTGDKVVLQDRYGNFLGANRQNIGLIITQANHAADFEIFKVKDCSDHNFNLSDFENNPLYIENDQLSWHKEEKYDSFNYELSDGKYFIKYGDKYLRTSKGVPRLSDQKGVIIHRLQRKNAFGGYLDIQDLIFITLSLLIFVYLLRRILLGLPLPMTTTLYTLIFIGHGLVAYFAISEFDFLWYWDEQFHALVGKNLSIDPFIPRLIREGCFGNQLNWVDADVWLHKQPIFLYQIALSIKLFGPTVFAVRIPSMILMSLLGIIIFRIADLMYNRIIALVSSMVYCFSSYKILLLFGYQQTDHNDIAFLFYLTASFWAFLEYQKNGNRKWYYLIAVFVAMAVLNKWLVGLLVYFCWTMYTLQKEDNIRSFWFGFQSIFKNFLIAICLILPWQLYILLRFPDIASNEYAENRRHFFEVVENKTGGFLYYFELASSYYFIPISLIILLSIISFFSTKKKKSHLSISFSIILVYLFFSLAATKMPSFTYIVSPFITIFIVSGMISIFTALETKYQVKKVLVHSGIFFLAIYYSFVSFDISRIEEVISPKGQNFTRINNEIRNSHYKDLPLDEINNSVLINCFYVENIRAMFHNNNLVAHRGIPNQDQMNNWLCKDKTIYVLDDGKLPSFITEDPSYVLIPNY